MKVGPNIFPLLGLLMQGDLGFWTCYTKPRRRIVVFTRAPPKTPASFDQQHQRNKWAADALLWQALTAAERDQWRQAARRGNLRISGFDLFIHARSNTNSNTHRTLAARFGLTLPTTPQP